MGYAGREREDRVPGWGHRWIREQTEYAGELADRIEPILRERARSMDPIFYGELGERLGLKPYDRPHRNPALGPALGIVTYRSLARDGYALSALVINRQQRRPGAPFFGWITDEKDPDEETMLALFRDEWRRITLAAFEERFGDITGNRSPGW